MSHCGHSVVRLYPCDPLGLHFCDASKKERTGFGGEAGELPLKGVCTGILPSSQFLLYRKTPRPMCWLWPNVSVWLSLSWQCRMVQTLYLACRLPVAESIWPILNGRVILIWPTFHDWLILIMLCNTTEPYRAGSSIRLISIMLTNSNIRCECDVRWMSFGVTSKSWWGKKTNVYRPISASSSADWDMLCITR